MKKLFLSLLFLSGITCSGQIFKPEVSISYMTTLGISSNGVSRSFNVGNGLEIAIKAALLKRKNFELLSGLKYAYAVYKFKYYPDGPSFPEVHSWYTNSLSTHTLQIPLEFRIVNSHHYFYSFSGALGLMLYDNLSSEFWLSDMNAHPMEKLLFSGEKKIKFNQTIYDVWSLGFGKMFQLNKIVITAGISYSQSLFANFRPSEPYPSKNDFAFNPRTFAVNLGLRL